MALFNGAPFLQRQIDTIDAQDEPLVDVWASDDGSTDGTNEIVRRALRAWGKGSFHLLDGPRRGAAENFRSLLTNTAIEADFYAFSDQDDEWVPDKLRVAIDWLEAQQGPALYCSRTLIVDSAGQTTGYSPLFSKPPCFQNALVQSIAGGNTMVMNRPARDLLAEASASATFVGHDWWAYLVITGAGGRVHYSPEPRTRYRQHGRNLIGENNSWRARFWRVREMLAGRFKQWNDVHAAALEPIRHRFTPAAQACLKEFERARNGRLAARLVALRRSGVFRQTRLGQIGLYLACAIRRL